MDSVRDGVRIVIMSPPFTNRSKMGEKFPKVTQQALRSRADEMERVLVRNDTALRDFVDKNALEPLFHHLGSVWLWCPACLGSGMANPKSKRSHNKE